jgi:hypothetical protein
MTKQELEAVVPPETKAHAWMVKRFEEMTNEDALISAQQPELATSLARLEAHLNPTFEHYNQVGYPMYLFHSWQLVENKYETPVAYLDDPLVHFLICAFDILEMSEIETRLEDPTTLPGLNEDEIRQLEAAVARWKEKQAHEPKLR